MLDMLIKRMSKSLWVDSEALEKEENLDAVFKNVKGIIVPGGFGSRGIPGMILACQYAREHNILIWDCVSVCKLPLSSLLETYVESRMLLLQSSMNLRKIQLSL